MRVTPTIYNNNSKSLRIINKETHDQNQLNLTKEKEDHVTLARDVEETTVTSPIQEIMITLSTDVFMGIIAEEINADFLILRTKTTITPQKIPNLLKVTTISNRKTI